MKNRRLTTRSHYVALRVTFDRPCSNAAAVRAVRDCVNGTFYPTAWDDRDPEQFDVRTALSVARIAKKVRRS